MYGTHSEMEHPYRRHHLLKTTAVAVAACILSILLFVFAADKFVTATPGTGPTGKPNEESKWRRIDPRKPSEVLPSALRSSAVSEGYWQTKPQSATYYYPLQVVASDSDREQVEKMKAGLFRPFHFFDWQDIGVPPPWGENSEQSTSWDYYRHSLRWAEPLIRVWAADGDTESLLLFKRIFRDWSEKNLPPPGQSDFAWYDHSVAGRLRILCWFWEIWRTTENYDYEFAQLLLGSIYQHAMCSCDPKMYAGHSNHGLEMTASLLAPAVGLPEFEAAEHWKRLALQRLSDYVEEHFCPTGFHLEQSPFYHWYVVDRLRRILLFLHANGESVPHAVQARMRRAWAVWPYLRKPDGVFPTIGDSQALNHELNPLASELLDGDEAIREALPVFPNLRQDGSQFLLSFRAGYAIFRSGNRLRQPDAPPSADTYAVFKCNSFSSPHCHNDALSFILYGLGRDWLVDAGQLNYEERTAARQYMRSSRAHNVLRISGQDFGYHNLELVEWGRDKRGDHVAVRHDLPEAAHTRRFRFVPPHVIELEDTVESNNQQMYVYEQLFHVAPGLQIKIFSNTHAALFADNGDRCDLRQAGDDGVWSVIEPQTEPEYQGWYSPVYGQLEKSPVLIYSSPEPSLRWLVHTRIELSSVSDNK